VLSCIQASPQRDRIQVTGYLRQEELDGLYRRASIFAFPSLDEGFGIPVLEAMAYGVPVVTSNRSALPEIAGDAALLVNPAHTEELGAALRQLIDDEGLRQRLSNAGQSRAASYSWDGAVQKTHAVYQELVK
jgi:glycosyltransferase involved in cell wall biosynthesis